MGHILPNWDEPKEPVGVITVILVHFILGLGIVIIGQRTKNRLEFWLGIIVFLIAIAFLVITLLSGTGTFPFGYGLFSAATWLYILGRLVWIFIKKETKLTIL